MKPIGNDPTFGGVKKKYFNVKDGKNVYRILPPFGSCAAENKWCVYESIHWGYSGSKGAKSFRCIQKVNPTTKMVIERCPECDKIAEIKAMKERQLKELVEVKKMPQAQAEEHIKPIKDWLFSHNKDSKWYANVMNRQMEIGRLKFCHRHYQALTLEAGKLLEKKKLNIIKINEGCWINFNRSGSSVQQMVHGCSAETISSEVDGEYIERIEKAPLSQEVLDRMQTEAWDLGDLFKTLSRNQIQRLVDSGGDPAVVDSVFTTPEAEPVSEDDGVADEAVMANLAKSLNTPDDVDPAPVAVAPAKAPIADVAVDTPKFTNEEFLAKFKKK